MREYENGCSRAVKQRRWFGSWRTIRLTLLLYGSSGGRQSSGIEGEGNIWTLLSCLQVKVVQKRRFIPLFVVNWKGLTAAQHWRTINWKLNKLCIHLRDSCTPTEFSAVGSSQKCFQQIKLGVRVYTKTCPRVFKAFLFLFGSRSSTLGGAVLWSQHAHKMSDSQRARSLHTWEAVRSWD